MAGSHRLYMDGDVGRGRDLRTYIKFKVSGLRGTVDRAVLRLWVTNATGNGPTVAPTRTGWSAGKLTWRNRPGPTGPVVADAGALAAGRWAEFDVMAAGPRQRDLRVPPALDVGRWPGGIIGEWGHPPRLVVRTASP